MTIGVEVALTGVEAELAVQELDGALMAIDDANTAGGVAGYKLDPLVLDGGSIIAGGFDPAQGATNARRFCSGSAGRRNRQSAGQRQRQGDVANSFGSQSRDGFSIFHKPDITDPKFAQEYRPHGRTIYLRMVSTDAYQAPNMADYMSNTLRVRSVFILDDASAVGAGQANACEQHDRVIQQAVLQRLQPMWDPMFSEHSYGFRPVLDLPMPGRGEAPCLDAREVEVVTATTEPESPACDERAREIGLRVLGHDHLNPLAEDYTGSLTKTLGDGSAPGQSSPNMVWSISEGLRLALMCVIGNSAYKSVQPSPTTPASNSST